MIDIKLSREINFKSIKTHRCVESGAGATCHNIELDSIMQVVIILLLETASINVLLILERTHTYMYCDLGMYYYNASCIKALM